MTDRQAKEKALRSLRKPYYAKIVDLSQLEFNIFKIVGEHVYKFNIVDHDWLPVRTQGGRDEVRARCEPIEAAAAAQILGWHLL